MTKGQQRKILITLFALVFFISGILSNLIAVIILIPLTITITNILKIKTNLLLIAEAIFITIGGTLLPISSIPTIF